MDSVTWAGLAFGVMGVGCASSPPPPTANLANQGEVPAVEGLPGESQTVGSLIEVAEKEGMREVQRKAFVGEDIEDPGARRSSKTGDEIDGCEPLQVYFQAGSAELDPVAESALRRLAACMTRHDEVIIEVMGHTGAHQRSSQLLRTARVDAVVDYLEARDVPEEHYSVRHGNDF